MTDKPSRMCWGFFWGATLAAGVFFYLTTLRIDFHHTFLLNLDPRPDACEYFATAVDMQRHGRYGIWIGDERFPSRYPSGYPTLIRLALALLPADQAILAPFRANEATGLLLLTGIACYYGWARRPLAGGVAVLGMATLPLFIAFSRSSMSDLLGSALIMAACAMVATGFRKKMPAWFYLAGFLLGLSINVRLQLVLYCPLIFTPFLLGRMLPFWVRFKTFFLSGICFVLGMLPTFILNFLIFGSPMRSGYDYWLGSGGGFSGVFQKKYLPQNFRLFSDSLCLSEHHYNMAVMFGSGVTLVPAALLAMLASIFICWKKRSHHCIAFATLIYTGFTLFYAFTDLRFFGPAIFMGIAGIAAATEYLFSCQDKIPLTLRVIWILLLASIFLGYPSQGRPPQHTKVWQCVQLTKLDTMGTDSLNYRAIQYFAHHGGETPSLLATPFNPAYVSALLPNQVEVIPNKSKYDYCWKFSYPSERLTESVQKALHVGKKVYALDIAKANPDDVITELTPPPGLVWTSQYQGSEGVLLELLPAGSIPK